MSGESIQDVPATAGSSKPRPSRVFSYRAASLIIASMVTHPYHTANCPEAKGKVGPTLGILATLAGIIGPFNIIPQIVEIFQTKSIANVSLLTYSIVIAIQVVWLVYALKLSLRPLIISSLVVLVLSGVIIFQFFLYGGLRV